MAFGKGQETTWPQWARCAAAMVLVLNSSGLLPNGVSAENEKTETSRPFALADCISIALQNQPAIHAQQAALGAATEQQKVARSYFLPQIGLSARFVVLDKPLSE